MNLVRQILLRPSLWVGLISIVAYWDTKALHGNFVYDDAGSVLKNVVVNGQVPFRDVLTRDFWGTPMKEVDSHKSFRPITTASFRANWVLNEYLGKEGKDTYQMRVTNVVMHGLVCLLVTETAGFLFDGGEKVDIVAQIITGALFAVHPVHAEAVSNITSRGEMLMSVFFLLAFLTFASTRTRGSRASLVRRLIGIYTIPCLCTALSLFSKEQGATTLITLVIWDFVNHHGSLNNFLEGLVQKDAQILQFLWRTFVLAVQTLGLGAFRYWLNGETKPDFIFDQNPAGFSEDRFTRVFSTSWVYCLYIRDAFYPMFLCPDWSGRSIDLIEDGSDTRIWGVLLLWAFAAATVASLVMGPPEDASTMYRQTRRVFIVAFLGFLFTPFFLSSNLVVVVGLMKADRVIYLPLLGWCMMEAQVFKAIFAEHDSLLATKTPSKIPSFFQGTHWIGQILVMVHLYLLTTKQHERNIAWHHSLDLWTKAYQINPRSHHTMYNCGYELSIQKRYKEAEHVMRPIGSAHVDGPSNTFVYAMVLYNLHRCDEAHYYIDEGMAVLDQRLAEGGTRNQPHMLARTRSNLLVARGHCTDDLKQKGAIMYAAVQADQRNDYAVQAATQVMNHIDKLKKANIPLDAL